MGRVVMITGASSGIGQAAARAFAYAGDYVVGTARRMDRLRALQDDVNTVDCPGDFVGVKGDVTRAKDMQHVVAEAINHFDELNILIANAGLGHRGAVADADWEDVQTLLRTNIDGVLHSIRAAVPAMRDAGGGHIIIISSVVYNLVSPYTALYAGSKAFVSSLAQSMRVELAQDNIAVTDVLVGRTHTEFNEKRLGEGKRTGQGIPTMTPERVAQALVKVSHTRRNRLILRPFDRLIVWGNRLVPGIMGELAKRQYR